MAFALFSLIRYLYHICCGASRNNFFYDKPVTIVRLDDLYMSSVFSGVFSKLRVGRSRGRPSCSFNAVIK